MLLVYYLSVIVCFPKRASVKIGDHLDKRMIQWQPAKCCIFQLFIIICYFANKVLLLLPARRSPADLFIYLFI